MKEYRTRLVGPKTPVGSQDVRFLSDWEYVQVFDDSGTFLLDGLMQNVTYLGAFVGQQIPTTRDYFGPTAPSNYKNEDQLYVSEMQVEDINCPTQNGRDPTTGYYPF